MNHARCSLLSFALLGRVVTLAALCAGSLPSAATAQSHAAQPSPTEIGVITQGLERMEYRFQRADGDEWSAPNRAQGLRSRIRATGIEVSPRTIDASAAGETWTLKLSTTGFGRDDSFAELGTGAVSGTAERVVIAHGPVEEWFVNDGRGLEQGWSVSSRPDGVSAEVCIGIEVKGDLSLRTSEDGLGGTFVDAQGKTKLRYHSLAAQDANGRALTVRLVPSPTGPQIRVSDAGAAYPITIDPIVSAAAWTAESDQQSALFGYSVSTAGDVNHDGFSDVIVGAYLFDNGQTDEGRAFVYLGSPSGLVATPVWTAEGNQIGARFGTSVAAAGDVNGDGFDDVIVGAYAYDNGQTDEGRAFVYLGSASGVGAVAAWTAESDQAGAYFGYSVATAGDVNGDGFSDVIVGAHAYDNGQTEEGRAFVYLGSASGLSATPAWTAEGNQADAYFGYSVSSCFDANGDGFDDVLVGAFGFDNGEVDEGRAFLYLGSASGLAATPAWTAEGNRADAYFGISVAPAGDVNGNGYADAIIGASHYTNGQSREGRAYLFNGTNYGLALAPVWTAEGNQVDANFGLFVSTAGDVNGDGFADVIIGAPSYDNGDIDEGAAYVYLGSPSGLLSTPEWRGEGQQVDVNFGVSVATAGDVNGDGFSDIVVGAYKFDSGQSDEGRAFVYFGSAGVMTEVPAWTAESDQASAQFGWSVASAGDVNGDGFSDVIVGAKFFDNGQQSEGEAFLYLGSASGLSLTPAWTADGDQEVAEFGWSVASAGDVNGDGFSDVIVGAPQFSNGQVFEGRAFLYLGSASGLSLTSAWTAESDQLQADFGSSVASAGDVNGDGFSDVIVGAQYFSNGQADEGRAFLYLGSASGLSLTPAWTAESDQVEAYFGSSVFSAGDVNGDGFGDVIVGAQYFDNGQQDEGGAFLYLGSASGLNLTPAWTAESDQVQALFGSSVAPAGDVNGDGFGDVIVGAKYFSNGQSFEGRAFLYVGSASGLSLTPTWTAESDQAGANLGSSVASAGDVNGDGFSDVIVGAPYLDNGQTNEGRAFLYLGSATGLSLTPAWTGESDQAGALFGSSVASAGDVNGDGFGDVIVGAYGFDNGQVDEGRASFFLGQTGAGAAWSPAQRRVSNNARISLLATTDPATSFLLETRASTGDGTSGTAAGRARVRLQWEIKDQASPLNGTSLQQSVASLDTGAAGSPALALNELVSGLVPGNRYRWRARVTTDNLFFPHSHWLSLAGNNVTEMKLRTVCDATLPGPDCDSNGIPDACEVTSTLGADCNHDGIPDACQLAGNDCDGNLIPDDCQLFGHDCNGNSILDLCEVLAGAPDSNNDQIPDSCQMGGIIGFCFGDGTGTACPCGNAGTAGNGCASSLFASGANLSYSGIASVAHDNFVLLGTAMPNSSALYFQGTAQQNAGAGSVFGDGLRCAAGSVIRLGTLVNTANASQYPRPTDPSVSVRGGITLGGTQRQYQIWYRNSANFCTTSTYNLSNGLRVIWQL
jgi:hypothetical protein